MQGGENDEAISIYALAMQARRLLRRPATAGLLAMTIPRSFNSLNIGCFSVRQRPSRNHQKSVDFTAVGVYNGYLCHSSRCS